MAWEKVNANIKEAHKIADEENMSFQDRVQMVCDAMVIGVAKTITIDEKKNDE